MKKTFAILGLSFLAIVFASLISLAKPPAIWYYDLYVAETNCHYLYNHPLWRTGWMCHGDTCSSPDEWNWDFDDGFDPGPIGYHPMGTSRWYSVTMFFATNCIHWQTRNVAAIRARKYDGYWSTNANDVPLYINPYQSWNMWVLHCTNGYIHVESLNPLP